MISPAELSELWEKHAGGLRLLLQARCSSDVDDLVQEAFIRLAAQSRIPDEPLAWLARTARNLAIDAVRKQSRRRKREQQFCHQNSSYLKDKQWFAPESDGEFELRTQRALMQLPELEREIVVAHLWNKMTFRQIAAAFDISSSQANRKYQTALERLRVSLESESQAVNL